MMVVSSLPLVKKLILVFLLTCLVGCAGTPTSIPDEVASGQPPPPPTEIPTPSPGEENDPLGPHILRVWVPPEFNPASGTEASQIFLARLGEFSAIYPEVQVEVRVKATLGPCGMLDSLSAIQAVAPEALPDLIALPRPVLETAAARGLVFPLESNLAFQEDVDWYDFAHQLARVENTLYGLPFACDALVLLYRVDMVGEPPRDWTTTQQTALPLLFPIGSSQALFTLALYQAAGGSIEDAQGYPTITPATLAAVFDFYRNSQQEGILSPGWIRFRTEEETFIAFQNREVDMTVAWVSAFWNRGAEDMASTGLPTSGGVPYTPLTGWVWAISNPRSTHQDFSNALAQFLTESSYLAEWTLAAGYLPPRPSALSAWPGSPRSALASRLVLSAELIPSVEVLNTLGPLIQQATVDVLNGLQTPSEAAQSVASRLGGP